MILSRGFGSLARAGHCLRFLPFANSLTSNMLDWTQCPAVERTPQKVSGEWVFRDTRVPVKALFENLEDGATVDDFVTWFPGVRREQAAAVLVFAEQTLTST